jgi:uncharacterized membrane protein YcaP (DUF421 family)
MTIDQMLDLFRFGLDPVELIVRGSAMYWFLFVLFRFVLHRGAGSIGIADILLLVLIADAAQNAMAGEYKTVADGALLVLTLAGWNWLLDWAAFHLPPVRRLVEAPATVLVRDGRLQRRAMRRELISESELMGALHKNNVERLEDVKLARMEGDGEISVIRKPG